MAHWGYRMGHSFAETGSLRLVTDDLSRTLNVAPDIEAIQARHLAFFNRLGHLCDIVGP
jgi:hypothetical protein